MYVLTMLPMSDTVTNLAALLIASAAMSGSLAATPKEQATDTVLKALRCELPSGKYKTVFKAIKVLGGVLDKEVGNQYHLPVPLDLFGVPVSTVALTDEEGEVYFAETKGVKTADLAKAANTVPGGRQYERSTKFGQITVQDSEQGARLMCEIVFREPSKKQGSK